MMIPHATPCLSNLRVISNLFLYMFYLLFLSKTSTIYFIYILYFSFFFFFYITFIYIHDDEQMGLFLYCIMDH